jgi:hypothetical protein
VPAFPIRINAIGLMKISAIGAIMGINRIMEAAKNVRIQML